MATSLMQKAAAGAPRGKSFTPPDIGKAVPPAMKDAVDRVFAAGFKIMYSPEMQDEREQAVQSPDPIPKKLAENVTGLMLTLDQQAKGGIPVEALFPAAMMLLSEAAEILTKAGQDVGEEDYLDAARMLFVLIGRKLGGSDEEIMGAAQQAMPEGGGEEEGEEMPPDEGGMPPGEVPPPEDEPIPDAVPPRPAAPPARGAPPSAVRETGELPDEDEVM